MPAPDRARRTPLLGLSRFALFLSTCLLAAPASGVEAAGPTLVRVSHWVPDDRVAEFAEIYDRELAPWFEEQGLRPYSGQARQTIEGVYSRLYEVDSPSEVKRVLHLLRGRLEFLRLWQDLGSRFGSQRDDGLLKGAFRLYETHLSEFPVVPAGPGRSRPLGPGRGRWRIYDVTDGLAGPMVLSLLQDRLGRMWFGTLNDGVSRFDGQRWVTFNTTQGLPSNSVNQVFEDANGGIWLATKKGVARFDEGAISGFAVDGDSLTTEVRRITQDPDGGLWFAVFGRGLAHFDGDRLRWYDHDRGLLDNRVTDMLWDRDGLLWVTGYSGVSRFDGRVWTTFTHDDGLPRGGATSVIQPSSGDLWIAFYGEGEPYDGGVARYDGSTWTTYDEDTSDVLERVMSAYEDVDGTLWFAGSAGVIRFREGAWESFAHEQGFTIPDAYGTLRDREGYLWFATMEGAARYDDDGLTIYSSEDGMPRGAWSMRHHADGDLWISHGSPDHGVTRLHGDTLTTYNEGDGLPGSHVYGTYEDAAGRLWVSTSEGAARLSDGQWSIFGDDHGLPSEGCATVLETGDGVLWFGSYYGLVRYDGSLVEVFGDEDGLPDAKISALHEARDGSIWIGTDGGVAHYDGRAFRSYDLDDGLGHPEVFDINEDDQGRLWFATHGGVSVFDGDSFTNYTTADGLTSNDVHSIAVDGKTVWIGTDGGGVSRFDGDVFQSLTARDGLPDNVALSVRPDGNGGVWIGTAQGLVHHRPRPSPDVPVVIDAVVADRRYAGVDSVAVPSTVDLIAIEFHSISLKTRVGQTVFCYRLAGEQGWRHTRDNRVEYHSLPRGDYTFEVLAVDRDLNYSAVPARISLSVHLPYERIAWLSLLGVTVVLLAWQATRIVRRDHRLQLSNRELEEKTRALEKAHQEVMQASQAKSAFLANVSHELRTPLNAIINFSALILENTYGDISDDLRDAVEEIDHNGDNLLNLINDVLDLSKIEAGAMKLQFAECAPSVCVETAVTAMLHRARNKGLALSGEVEDDLPELWADQRRLTQQVLVNLVDNAIKFTNQGDVRVGAARDNGDVHFWVADTGQGIASADRDRVFQPFYQVDGTATRAAGGTGLGLAIVRRFVELHGGSIWLESEEGRGSTFHFRIPHSPSTGG